MISYSRIWLLSSLLFHSFSLRWQEMRETELLLAESDNEIKTAIEEELVGFNTQIALLEVSGLQFERG